MRSYYPGITLFKLAGALLVVLAHVLLIQMMVEIPEQQYQFALLPLRIIVPCFYVVSGFLAYEGWSHAANPRSYVKRYVIRIGILYAFFCVLFMIRFTFPALLSNGLGLGNLWLQAKILGVAVFLNGPFIQLWFIPPLIFSILLCYWFHEKGLYRAAIILGGVGFIICQLVSGSLREVTLGILSVDHYPSSGVLYELISWMTRYFGMGFTFVLAGVILARVQNRINSFNPSKLILLTIGLTLLETFILLRYAHWDVGYKLAFSLLPGTLLLFYGILRIKIQVIRTYHKFINLFSIIAFCCHIPFMQLNLYLLGWHHNSLSGLQGVMYLCMTLVECLIMTVVWYNVSIRKINSAKLPLEGFTNY